LYQKKPGYSRKNTGIAQKPTGKKKPGPKTVPQAKDTPFLKKKSLTRSAEKHLQKTRNRVQ
jgi:hypothetical protein